MKVPEFDRKWCFRLVIFTKNEYKYIFSHCINRSFYLFFFHLFSFTRHLHRWFMHQPRMLLFFFHSKLLLICMPSHPLFVNPDRIQDENSKKGFPRGQIDIDDIDYRRLVETIQSLFSTCLRWQSFVPQNIFHIRVPRVYSVPCFFQTSRHATAVRATWIENMSQFNEFPRVGETISIFKLAIEYGLVDQVEFRRINRCTSWTVFFVAHRLANL